MTDAAVVTTKARALATAARRTLDWLDDRRDVLPLQRAVLVDALQRLDHEAQHLARASDTRSRLAVLAPWIDDVGRWIAAFAAPRDGGAIGRFHGSITRLPLSDSLCPPRSRTGLTAVLHVTHADAAETTIAAAAQAMRTAWTEDTARPAAADAAIHVTLLGLADVIDILACAWLGNVANSGDTPVSAADVDAVVRDVATGATGAIHAGLLASDVHRLRRNLAQRFDRHPRIVALEAAGYWEAFGHLAPRITLDGRRRLASLLWDEAADVDALFGALGGALDGLGHAGDVICPAEAVRDPASGPGFGRAHVQSILTVDTAMALGATEPITVRTRFGACVAIERALVALLAAAVDVSVEGDPNAVLAALDLLVLPTACPGPEPRRTDPLAQRPDPSWLATAVVQAKTLHLVQRSLADIDTTGLLVQIDGRAPVPAAVAPIVSAWVRDAHGATPAEREARDTTLFVTLPAATAQTPDADKSWTSLDPLAGHTRGSDSWVHDWTPGRAFDNVFLVGDSRASQDSRDVLRNLPVQLHLAPDTALSGAPTRRSGSWAPHVRNPAVALDEALHTRDGGLRYLVQSIGAVDMARARRRRIDARVSELSRSMRDRLGRHFAGADAAQDRRHRAALTVQARLRRIVDARGLGPLLASLGVAESEARIAFDRLDDAAMPWADPDVPMLLAATAASELAMRYARTIVTTWARRVADLACDAPRADRLGTTPWVAETLVDELLVAVVRTDLDARLAARIARVLSSSALTRRRACELAALIARDTIAAFVAELGFEGPWTATRPRRRGTLGAPLFERQSAATAQALATVDANRLVAQYGADWLDAWSAMVDANLAFVRGMRFEARTQRDIEELTALFGPSQGSGGP